MQHVVYFVVAVAIAAALLTLASQYFGLLNVYAPLDSAYALVYVVPRPVNDSAVWIGVTPAYADVTVRYVSVNGTAYALGVDVPRNTTVWLNRTDGRPLAARCWQSVEVVAQHGSGLAASRFVVQCPKTGPRLAVTQIVDVAKLVAFANGLLDWFGSMKTPKLAATVDPQTMQLVVKNIGDKPVFVLPAYGNNYLFDSLMFLAPGGEWRLSGAGRSWDVNARWSATYYADVRLEGSSIVGWVNGIPVNITAQPVRVPLKAQIDASAAAYCVSYFWSKGQVCNWNPVSQYGTIYGGVYQYARIGLENVYWPLLLFNVSNGVLYVGHSVYDPARRELRVEWSRAPWRGNVTYWTGGSPAAPAQDQIGWTLYVFPADYAVSNGTVAGALALSPFRQLQIEAVPTPLGWTVQWPNEWSADADNVSSTLVPPGGAAAVPAPVGNYYFALPRSSAFPFVGLTNMTAWINAYGSLSVSGPIAAVPPGAQGGCQYTARRDATQWYIWYIDGSCTYARGGGTLYAEYHGKWDQVGNFFWQLDVKVYLDGGLIASYSWYRRALIYNPVYTYSGLPLTRGVAFYVDGNDTLYYYGPWTGTAASRVAFTVAKVWTTRGAQVYRLTYRLNLPCTPDGSPTSGYAYALLELNSSGTWEPTSFGLVRANYSAKCPPQTPPPPPSSGHSAPTCPVQRRERVIAGGISNVQQTPQGVLVTVSRTYEVTVTDCNGNTYTYTERREVTTIQTIEGVIKIYDPNSRTDCPGRKARFNERTGYLECPK